MQKFKVLVAVEIEASVSECGELKIHGMLNPTLKEIERSMVVFPKETVEPKEIPWAVIGNYAVLPARLALTGIAAV